MKKKELVTLQRNRKTAAYVPIGNDPVDSLAYEVRILDVNASRIVHGRSRAEMWSSGHEAHGIKIEYVEKRERQVEVVPAAKLRSSWAEYTALRDARKTREQKAKDKLEWTKSESEKAAAELGRVLAMSGVEVKFNDIEIVGVGGHSYGRHWQAPYAYGVRVSPQILNYLLSHHEE